MSEMAIGQATRIHHKKQPTSYQQYNQRQAPHKIGEGGKKRFHVVILIVFRLLP